MKDKVFWSILGAILVGWILLFFLFVWPKMQSYNEVTGQLKSKKTAIQRYAKMSADDLPTEDLVEAQEKYLANWKKQIDRAEQFHKNRSALFIEGVVGDLSSWSTRYRDDFNLLQSRYRKHVGLDAEAELPFQVQEEAGDPAMIAAYERRWRVQKELVDRIIAIQGASIEELSIDKKTRRGGGDSSDDGLIKFPVVLRAQVPPSRIGGIVDGLLRHNFIDFEIRHLAMAKHRESLVYEVVEKITAGELGLDSEPPVRLLLELDVIEAVSAVESE